MDERAWFVLNDMSRPPVYVAEAACPAFATRFRQSLGTAGRAIPHLPKIHHVADEHLALPYQDPVVWPTKTDAHLFVKVAGARINRGFHVILNGPTLAKLNQAYTSGESLRPDETCKLFALFALGQVYSSSARQSSIESDFPGLSYFKQANQILQVLPENPTLEHVEASVLLVSF
jgi:hypothetical protein